MALVLKDGAVDDDGWRAAPDDADTLPDGPVIVGLARWRRERATLSTRNAPLGVRLASDQRAEEIAADLDRFTLVVLEFPVFRDGRAFSTARELRERYGYTGDIRATGHILPDQAQFLARTGFTTVDLPDTANRESWRHALGEITIAYQPAVTDDLPLSNLRRRIGG